MAQKYLEAGIFLYPTQFYEIDCISAAKAQIAGCYPVTSDAFALNETVENGTKIHTDTKRWGTENTFGDMDNIDKYVDAVIENVGKTVNGSEIKKKRNWNNIAQVWLNVLG